MSNKLYEEDDIQDIADAIRDKNGSSDTYMVSEMAAAISAIQTQASVVNGVIESYKAATTTVAANTFVEFVNKYSEGIESGSDTQIASINSAVTPISAIALDSSTVFVAYCDVSSYNHYGVVCTISGSTITVGTAVQISTGTLYYRGPTSAIALDSSTIFVTYGNGYYHYGVVCTISGSTITVGTAVQLSTSLDYGVSSATALDSSTVFVAMCVSSSRSLYGVVCTISGTTITVGTDTQLSSTSYAGINHSATALDSSKVFVAYRGGSSGYPYGMVCTISGTTITTGAETQIGNRALSTSTTSLSATLLDSSTIFVAYDTVSVAYLYGVVCTISGTTITAGTPTSLGGHSNYTNVISATALDSSTVFVAHKYSSSLYGVVCTISGTTITAGTNTQLSSVEPYSIAATVIGSAVCVFGGNYSAILGLVATGAKTVMASSTKIEGLTSTECTTSTAGSVYVLN